MKIAKTGLTLLPILALRADCGGASRLRADFHGHSGSGSRRPHSLRHGNAHGHSNSARTISALPSFPPSAVCK